MTGTAPRPVLAIVHGEGSVSAMQLVASAKPVSDVVWVVDSDEPEVSTMLRLLRRLGTTVDVAGLSADEAAEALRPCRPDGVAAYADRQIPLAAALAARLGLTYPDETTAHRLVDKLAQRQALRAGGLDVPNCVALPPHAAATDLDEVARTVTFPAVLKPRAGAGSRDTVLVHDRAELEHALERAESARGADAGAGAGVATAVATMVVEEYIPGILPPGAAGGAEAEIADYVSVESVVCAGRISHAAVTGHFPPADPFRESGFFIPSTLSAPEVDAVVAEAEAAIGALGVETGFLHTEVKLTPKGPRVIEVNGRLGGGVPEMLQLASGVDLFELSARLAVGERVGFDRLVRNERVAYLLYVQAPQWARRLEQIDGLDALEAHPGVDTIVLNRRPGDALDWREGNHGHVFSVLGTVPDHDALPPLRRVVEQKVTMRYA